MKQQPTPEELGPTSDQSVTSDPKTCDRIARYLSDDFELEAHERLVRARQAAMQPDDVPIVDDSQLK